MTLEGVIYNLGCGNNKIANAINVDIEPSVNPDKVVAFHKEPFAEEHSVDTVLLFHVIEHIEEKHHLGLLKNIHNALKEGGSFICSYPEFRVCAKYYLDNTRGHRDFWKNTIYGLQRYPSDFHVSLMDTLYFQDLLKEVGFEVVKISPEPGEEWNTVIHCKRVKPMTTYEQVLQEAIWGR